MKQLIRNLFGILLLSAASLPVVYSQSSKTSSQPLVNKNGSVGQVLQPPQGGLLIEEFSFLIKDFKLDHQTETNNLNISISYRYVVNITKSEYPDFRLLAKDVETFLTNYPNESDYWEIVNKQLTSLLMKKYPAIMSITSEVKADPTRLDPYTRSSRVTRERPSVRSNQKRLG